MATVKILGDNLWNEISANLPKNLFRQKATLLKLIRKLGPHKNNTIKREREREKIHVEEKAMETNRVEQ